MNDRKTQRKNKTNLVVKWPSNDDYFFITGGPDGSLASKALTTLNPDFIEITLRVHLKKAIEEKKLVAEIGCKNTGLGRPVKAFAMTPVNPLVLEKAKEDGIMLNSITTPVVQVTQNTPITLVSSSPTKNIVTNITTHTVSV